MKHIGRIFHLCCIAALLGGCAATLPVQEVRQVGAAYDAAAAAGEPLLNELAIAERHGERVAPPAGTRTITEGDVTVFRQFDKGRAASYASIGEPKSTAQQRRGLKVVGAYIDVLEILAEGRNIEEAKAQIKTLATNVGGLAALVTGGASAFVGPFVDALGPIIERAARANNAEELRATVLEGAPLIDTLIADLIDSTPAIYSVLIKEAETAADGPLFNNPAARRAELLKIGAYHVAVANYVVLLQQLRATFAALAETVRAPSRTTLAALTASSNDLVIQADSVRRAYAILRRP